MDIGRAGSNVVVTHDPHGGLAPRSPASGDAGLTCPRVLSPRSQPTNIRACRYRASFDAGSRDDLSTSTRNWPNANSMSRREGSLILAMVVYRDSQVGQYGCQVGRVNHAAHVPLANPAITEFLVQPTGGVNTSLERWVSPLLSSAALDWDQRSAATVSMPQRRLYGLHRRAQRTVQGASNVARIKSRHTLVVERPCFVVGGRRTSGIPLAPKARIGLGFRSFRRDCVGLPEQRAPTPSRLSHGWGDGGICRMTF